MVEWHDRKHVTRRLRLRGHDYSEPGAYFVTICVEKRRCLFGDVSAGIMLPNIAGTVIESWWCTLPRRFPSVLLDAYVVMPNHFHGLLFLGTVPEEQGSTALLTLSDVMGWFKGVTTNDYIRGVRTDGWHRFSGRLWQQNFYEHIIRSDTELDRYRAYIDANPSQWEEDADNPQRFM